MSEEELITFDLSYAERMMDRLMRTLLTQDFYCSEDPNNSICIDWTFLKDAECQKKS